MYFCSALFDILWHADLHWHHKEPDIWSFSCGYGESSGGGHFSKPASSKFSHHQKEPREQWHVSLVLWCSQKKGSKAKEMACSVLRQLGTLGFVKDVNDREPYARLNYLARTDGWQGPSKSCFASGWNDKESNRYREERLKLEVYFNTVHRLSYSMPTIAWDRIEFQLSYRE